MDNDQTQNAQNVKARTQALTTINRDLEEKVVQEKAVQLKMPYIDVGAFPINPDVLHVVSPQEAKLAGLMPFYKSGKRIRIAVSDPHNEQMLRVVKMLEGKGQQVQLNLASAASIEQAYKLYGSDQYRSAVAIKNVVKENEINYEKELENLVQLKEKLAVMPSEEALNLLNVSAIKAGASDLHFQPEENGCTVRFRIDGVLHQVFEISSAVFANLANQLKYKSKMKLNVTTVPQDGRFAFTVNEVKIDVRVSSIPTEYGESFVCRILNTAKNFGDFKELGFSGKNLELLESAKNLTQGMVLVTGPTSSGKTTTLYVLLTKFNSPDVKIITLEDPIEYHLRGVTQSQINEKRGYGFAEGLRSVLRQDPDTVMVGEIRDLETARVCAQAALTGHVVLSTLHTTSAVDTVPRLVTIGLSPVMIAPALSMVVAQRLVRKLCGGCKKARAVTVEEKLVLEKSLKEIQAILPKSEITVPQEIFKPVGCEECNTIGYRGQMVICEVLALDDELRTAILNNASSGDVLKLGQKKGMLTMFQDGILKVLAGETTLSELQRVIAT